MPCAYVLLSEKTNKHYTGSSRENDPFSRIKEHNSGRVKSTKSGMPWKLVYFEVFDEYTVARKREIFLKSGVGRRWLKDPLPHP
jgi:putative endonuclease